MIPFQGAIWIAPAPVDMRRGMNGLSHYVQQTLGHNPCAGEAFLFRNKAGNRIKVLLWDGNGVWLCQRRLHRRHFTWPEADSLSFFLTQEEWSWLIKGADWRRVHAQPSPHWMP